MKWRQLCSIYPPYGPCQTPLRLFFGISRNKDAINEGSLHLVSEEKIEVYLLGLLPSISQHFVGIITFQKGCQGVSFALVDQLNGVGEPIVLTFFYSSELLHSGSQIPHLCHTIGYSVNGMAPG